MDSDMTAKTLHVIQTAAIAGLIFAACAVWPIIKLRLELAKLPTINDFGTGEKYRQTYFFSARKIFATGYARFKDSAYTLITDSGETTVIIPPHLLLELRKLPENVLSASKAVVDLLQVKYTHIAIDGAPVINTVRGDLTTALTRLNPVVSKEVDDCLKQYLPPCEDWTPIKIFETLVPIVAQVSGRVFVGPELSKAPEYLDTASNYSVNITDAMTSLKKIRPWLKPFLAPRCKEVIELRKREKQAEALLGPIIKQRMESKANDPNWEEPDDALQWMINRAKGEVDVKTLVMYQLSLIFGAIHTTTVTATHVLYSLMATPEYIKPLREEINTVLAKNDGKFTARAIQQLEKLDSYMKEVLRFYPPTLTSFNRYTLQGITLSNGQYIPPGVMIEAASAAIHTDDRFFPSAEQFDGLRSYKLRASGKAQDIARNQFVTANETNLAFGYGAHACPGRFFAAVEIKMIVANLLLKYDIKRPDGLAEKYPHLELSKWIIPDASKTLLFKLREV